MIPLTGLIPPYFYSCFIYLFDYNICKCNIPLHCTSNRPYLFDSIFFSFLVNGEFESLKGSGMRRCQVVIFNGKLKF